SAARSAHRGPAAINSARLIGGRVIAGASSPRIAAMADVRAWYAARASLGQLHARQYAAAGGGAMPYPHGHGAAVATTNGREAPMRAIASRAAWSEERWNSGS